MIHVRLVPGYALRANRHGVARKISTFNIIVILVACGVTIVFYVHNILAVNRLAFEISQLEQKYQSIKNSNAALQAEVTKKRPWTASGPWQASS